LNAIVSGGITLPAVIAFIGWLITLEIKRRSEQRRLNYAYEQEIEQRRARQRDHVARCKQQLKELQDQERVGYERAVASWNAAMVPYKQEAARRRESALAAKERVQHAEEQWKAASAAANRLFDQKKAELQTRRNEYNQLALQREGEWKQMQNNARQAQFVSHLSLHSIEVAAIPDIGPARKAALNAHGIRTALDVNEDRVRRIPRFGPALTANLMEWRRNVEATFIFKVSNAIPRQEIDAFEAKYDRLRGLIQRQLEDGENALRRISEDAVKHLHQLSQQIEACAVTLFQAEADLQPIPSGL
jgi:DNA-binding helix-hairpin-helix protein with protein kinase domain